MRRGRKSSRSKKKEDKRVEKKGEYTEEKRNVRK